MKIPSSALLGASMLLCSLALAQDGVGIPVVPDVVASTPCQTGIYREDQAAFVALSKAEKGVNYTFSDGRTGNTRNAIAAVACGDHVVIVAGQQQWPRVSIAETDTRFDAAGVLLAGRLMEAPGADQNTPLLVYAHGSEATGWIDRARDPYQMLGRGISVFVYDKRGTGLSKGDYSQNFPQLADDLVAASREARRLASGRYGRFGLIGLSQGGWIVPLAAHRAQAQFIGIGYGLAIDIAEQDAAQVGKELRDRGYGDDIVVKGRMVTDITARLVKSGYRDGQDALAAVQQQFGREAWFSRIKGGYTGVFLHTPVEELRNNGIPQFARLNVDWSQDPMRVLSTVTVPQLWAFADEDRQAPGASTLERLATLRTQGEEIVIYRFPDADHGMREYDEGKDGARKSTRIAPGFYDLMADWAKGKLGGSYGKAYRR